VEEREGLDPAEKHELVRRAVLEEVRKHFRPEFLNRLDDILVFRRLTRDQMERIVDIQLRGFEKRLARRGLSLNVTQPAKQLLIQDGWDPQYGARPLKRSIQRLIEDELAKKILGGEFAQGDTVTVGRSGEHLTFEKVQLN